MSRQENDHWRRTFQARFDIQNLLLDQHSFISDSRNDEYLQGDDLDRWCQVFSLLMGAGFSLWRAAFLANDDRKRETIIRHAQSFLRFLIRDNAIGFNQDRDTQAWTASYYINNANFSLLQLHYLALELLGDNEASIKELRAKTNGDIVCGTSWSIQNRVETIVLWENSFRNVKHCFSKFTEVVDGIKGVSVEDKKSQAAAPVSLEKPSKPRQRKSRS